MAEGVVKRFAPAAERNRDAIAAVLGQVLPARGRVLEVASGSGQHARYFGSLFPHLEWQPSDGDPAALASIAAWSREAGLSNVAPPLCLDVTADAWPVDRADFILNCNMIHIAPWRACQGLMAGAGRLLPPGGALLLYGPFFIQGRDTAPSNIAFDRSLRTRDPEWGVRQIYEVEAEAGAHGLTREAVYDMPANNVAVVFRKRGAQ